MCDNNCTCEGSCGDDCECKKPKHNELELKRFRKAHAEITKRYQDLLLVEDPIEFKDESEAASSFEKMMLRFFKGDLKPEDPECEFILRMWEQVAQYAVGKFMLTRDLDTEFTFGCDICGDCCKGRSDNAINVHLHELLNIAEFLHMPVQEVVDQFMYVTYSNRNRPMFELANIPGQSIGGADYCSFLVSKPEAEVIPGGDPAKLVQVCMINDVKPGTCALFPLGRVQEYTREGEGYSEADIIYMIQHSGCQDKLICQPQKHTIREFISGTSLDKHDLLFDEYQNSLNAYEKHIMPVIAKLEKAKGPAVGQIYEKVMETMTGLMITWKEGSTMDGKELTKVEFLKFLTESYIHLGEEDSLLNILIDSFVEVDEGIMSGRFPLVAMEPLTRFFTMETASFLGGLLTFDEKEISNITKTIDEVMVKYEVPEDMRKPYTPEMALDQLEQLAKSGELGEETERALNAVNAIKGIQQSLNDPNLNNDDKRKLLKKALEGHLPSNFTLS